MSLILRELPSIEPVDVEACLHSRSPSTRNRELTNFRDQAGQLGLVILRDPDVHEEDNQRFLHLMERYFAQDAAALMADVRPDVFRQVGYTEPDVEEDNRFFDKMAALPEHAKPYGANHHAPNPLARFFWRVGSRDGASSDFQELHADPVIPSAFASEWRETMDGWGTKLHDEGYRFCQITELAFDLEPGTLVRRLQYGPHLLAPTGCDLMWLLSRATGIDREDLATCLIETNNLRALADELKLVGHVISRFHLDFNGGPSLHGRSNFPGLIGWTRKGVPFQVKVPEGCLLAQFGQQMEHLFAGGVNPGGIEAGFHEVAVIHPTLVALQTALREGRSTVRSGSTCFMHFNSTGPLEVLPQFRNLPGALTRYPDTLVGTHSLGVIQSLGLGKAAQPG